MGALEIAQELVMVAGDVEDARALAALAQQLLDDIIVLLRPVPAAAQAPAIDDIPDEIDRIGIVILQEIQKKTGFRTFRTEMDIGKKKSAEFAGLVLDHDADLRSALTQGVRLR